MYTIFLFLCKNKFNNFENFIQMIFFVNNKTIDNMFNFVLNSLYPYATNRRQRIYHSF